MGNKKEPFLDTMGWLTVIGFIIMGIAGATVFAFSTFETKSDHLTDMTRVFQSLDRLEGWAGTKPKKGAGQ